MEWEKKKRIHWGCSTKVPKGGKIYNEVQKIFEKIILKNFPKLVKDNNYKLKIQYTLKINQK